MPTPNPQILAQPIAILGAGELVSHVYRPSRDGESAEYRFNLFRITEQGQVTQQLRTVDLQDIVKLCQVLAFAIADDGWSEPQIQRGLLHLNEQLDGLTQTWEGDMDE